VTDKENYNLMYSRHFDNIMLWWRNTIWSR